MHSDANIGPALNKISIRFGLWNLRSASRRFLVIWIIERSTGSSGTNVDIVGMIKNVNVRIYVPYMEVIVAVMRQGVRAPIGTKHLPCFTERVCELFGYEVHARAGI